MDIAADGHFSMTGGSPDISAGGRYVTFTSCDPLLAPPYEADEVEPWPCDLDVFVRDRVKDVTKRVTIPWNNTENEQPSTREPAITGDGRYVALVSSGMTDDYTTGWDVYLAQLW